MTNRMMWVGATDLVHWADTRHAQANLPLLVRRLILTSVDKIGQISMPAGDSIYRPGWDGRLDTQAAKCPVPTGASVWEFGTSNDIRDKATADLKKRAEDPLGVVPVDTTFVFVTPRRWQQKEKWSAEQTATWFWRKVLVLDADDLETWLDQSPAVASWFARVVGKQPEGVEALDSFWQRAISDTEPCLTPEIILAGREQLCEKFEQWAEGSHQILRLKADTREEALLLLAAWARQEGGPAEQFLFANAIIVHSEEAWRQATASNRPLILIPLMNGGPLGLGEATDRGHRIVVPSGWDVPEIPEIEVAPWLERQRLQAGLIRAGLDEVTADRIAGDCGRSLQVLIRQLAKAPERRTPAWARHKEAQALLPLLFAGRWQCNRQGDKAVIAKLAGCSYEEAERNVSRWLHEPDPPVRRYGDVLLLTSPLDAWHQLGRHVSQQAWHQYREVLTTLLNRRDPALDLPLNQRWAASLYGKEHPESDKLREGLVEQLARLVGAQDRIGLTVDPSPASVAQRILQDCLSPAGDVERWIAIKEYLPDLAEAAPNVWLDSLERLLTNDEAAASLFEEAGLFSTSPHVFIMFAIERLRWFPEHFARCAEGLVQLSKLDPGHNSWPRPSSVFDETFCLLRPENNIPFQDQVTSLKILAARHPQHIWPLLVDLLPKDQWRIVNHGPRFRSVSVEVDAPKTWGEFNERVQHLVNFLVELADEQPARWAELIKDVYRLPPAARSTLVTSLAEAAPQLKKEEQATELYQELMQLLRRHRRHSHAHWALPANETDRLEELARTLEPADPVDLHCWLFRDPWLHVDLECSPESMQGKQVAAVQHALAAGGMGALARLAAKTAYPGLIGRAAAAAVVADEERKSLLAFFLAREDRRSDTVVRCYVEELFRDQRIPVSDFIAKYACVINGRSFGVFAQGLPAGSETWDALEARGEDADAAYWKSDIFLGRNEHEIERAVRAMLRHNQVASAVEAIAYSRCVISSEIIFETLKRIPAFLNDSAHIQDLNRLRYSVERMFELLDDNGDMSDQQFVQLEIAFFPLLEHTNRKFPAILRHARENPEFFVELLRLRFKRCDGKEDDDLKVLSSERHKQLSDLAFDILHEFDAIPGLNSTETGAFQHMRSWISQVLNSAARVGRREIGESKIGEALAKARVDEGEPWPRDQVCDVIEEFWSDRLATGFYCGCVNKLGVRCVAEGEADKAPAAQYKAWAMHRKFTHPHVCALLKELSGNFALDAKRHKMDAELRRQIE